MNAANASVFRPYLNMGLGFGDQRRGTARPAGGPFAFSPLPSGESVSSVVRRYSPVGSAVWTAPESLARTADPTEADEIDPASKPRTPAWSQRPCGRPSLSDRSRSAYVLK